MPLITCPECTKEISDRATACPHCGFPLNSDQVPAPPPKKREDSGEADVWFDFGILLIIAGVACALYFYFGYSTGVSTAFGDFHNLGLMQNRQPGLIAGVWHLPARRQDGRIPKGHPQRRLRNQAAANTSL